MSESALLRNELEPGIVTLTFYGPDKLNALSTPLLRQLETEVERVYTEATTRVVILTGAGDRTFVAGADLDEYRGNRAKEFIAYQMESRRIFDKLEALPMPTIAAIRGYALGGGFELALCCDVILCAESARLDLPEGFARPFATRRRHTAPHARWRECLRGRSPGAARRDSLRRLGPPFRRLLRTVPGSSYLA
jgi:enoyl-CoA hydratase/carnithine racemase